MKLAIHHREGSFSNRWIEFCKKNDIQYKIVNAFETDIISQLKDCNAFLWHHSHVEFKDVLVAKKILFALEHAKIPVFPDFHTDWYFDDKIAQKYLLEAIGYPIVPTYVFYNKKEAISWAKKTTYPIVFKLTSGAGAANVKLIKSEIQAVYHINKAFSGGFSQFNRWGYLKERISKFKNNKDNILGVFKGIIRLFIPTKFSRLQHREKNYILFQEFIPNNNFDIRVIVIGNRAFAVKRMVRKNDFRASGSNDPRYNQVEIDLRCIKLAFEINDIIKSQSVGFDFVFDRNNKPLIVEFGYGFAIEFYDPCPGYWDKNLKWHEGFFNPQEWILSDFLNSILKGY